MQTIKLYRFIRPDGGVTVSIIKPETEYTELYRLIADEGKILTDGNDFVCCIDTNNPSIWSEIPDAGDEATEADYQGALREMGVEV